MSLLRETESVAPSRKGRFALIGLLAIAAGAGYHLWTSPPDWLPSFGEGAPGTAAGDSSGAAGRAGAGARTGAGTRARTGAGP